MHAVKALEARCKDTTHIHQWFLWQKSRQKTKNTIAHSGFLWPSGQLTHQVSGDQIGQSLFLWQIPGTQRSWMKRCRTPREREKRKTDTLCVTSRLYKGAYHQSVSSWCSEKMKYHVKGAERHSYSWHLIWRFSAEEHKHKHTQPQCSHVPSGLLHFAQHTWTQTIHDAAHTHILWPAYLIISGCVCIWGAWGWGIIWERGVEGGLSRPDYRAMI